MKHFDDLHLTPFKIRLKDRDAELLRALASKLDQPPAVILRAWCVRELERLSMSLPEAGEKRRPC